MSMFHILSTLSLLAAPAFAALATTTRYSDGQEGACGCGVNSAFSWQYEIAPGVYTAAGSQVLFDADNSSWCGAGCGVCYKLTNQGYSGCSTCGSTAGAGESIIVMVTNLCPHNGNEVWCPAVGATNNYGYGAHFDIMSTTLVNGTWDNPVVEYEQVTCPVAAMNDWAQCVCYDGIAPGTSSTSKPASTSSTSSTHSSTSSSTKAVSTTSSTTTKAASTTAHTSTSTTSSHVSTSSSSSGSGLAALYGQCGGIGWTGPTACAVGTCVYNNDWYSQCLEGQGQVNILSTSSSTAPSCSTPASTSAAPLYGQCGGINWTGATTCAEGTCQYNNDWYSQCLPATGKRAARHHPKHIN